MGFAFEAGRVAGARKDFTEARRLYDKAAAAGYLMVFNNIGALYERGDGTRLDCAQAVNWYKKAVDLGELIAMVDRGYQYENGHGVEKDCAEAVRLYETAVKAGILSGDEQSRPALSAGQMRLPATMPRRAA
jgi:TPR repeat protein